ncbi:hypothetical protein Rsub_12653, partial [Raphidocelis subcapitata]
TSAAALRRVPFAQQEVARMAADAAALAAGTRELAAATGTAADAASTVTAPLAALHAAKARMEAACATLREATELTGAFRQVEELFAAGDLPRVAELLRSMGRSLSLVGAVPEFREGRARLAALEDRLQRRVEGALADALASGDAAEVAKLAGVLLAVGRGPTLDKLYTSARAPGVTAAWEAALVPAAAAATGEADQGASGYAGSARLTASALCAANTAALDGLESESAWLAATLPNERPRLLAALSTAALAKANTRLRELMGGLSATEALRPLLAEGAALARGLASLLSAASTGQEGVLAALCAVLEPYEEQVSRIPALEDAALVANLSGAVGGDPTTGELDTAAAALAGGLAPAFGAMRAALDRCVDLSGGTELPQLARVLDSAAAGYLERLQAAAGVLHGRFSASAEAAAATALGLGGGAAGGLAIGAPDNLGAVLSLVVLAQRAASATAELEAATRAAVVTSASRAAAAASAAAAAGPSAVAAAELLSLRLAAFPRKLAPLERLAGAADHDLRFIALPRATGAAAALSEASAALVHAALLAPVDRALEALPPLPVWSSDAAAGAAGGAATPAFSAYPHPLVTAVGEYLLGLPGHLEALMADDGGAGEAGEARGGGDELAADWLDRIVSAAGRSYTDAVLRIPTLSITGGGQLAADAEYFSNVMGALVVAPPPALATLQVFAALPADQFSEAASAAVAAGSAEARLLRRLAEMRGGIGWEGGSAPPAPAQAAVGDGP